jgi:hypothetical protein
MPTTPTPARPGQVWQSRDKRGGRRVRVIEVPDDPRAAGARAVVQSTLGRRSRIMLDHRGGLTGYRLVEDTTTTEGETR